MAKKVDSDGIVLARLQGGNENEGGAGGCAVMLFLGAIAMIFAIILESSAIRLTAWGAIWTGWNVLWGIGVLANRHTNYVVHRINQPPSE